MKVWLPWIMILGIIAHSIWKIKKQQLGDRFLRGGRPWDAVRPSIYEFIKTNITEQSAILEPPPNLPDERAFFEDRAWDTGRTVADPRELMESFRECMHSPSPEGRALLYANLVLDSSMPILELLVPANRHLIPLADKELWILAENLATSSPDRNPVKVGMMLLALFPQNQRAEQILSVLHRHPEFSWLVDKIKGTESGKETEAETEPEEEQ